MKNFIFLAFLFCFIPASWAPCAVINNHVSIISMSDDQLKYCPPVIAQDGSAVIKLLAIYLETPQQVHVSWYLDDKTVLNYQLNVDAAPYFENGFLTLMGPTLDDFNAEGIHTVRVEIYDSFENLLAQDEKSYEIVSCSSGSLALGTPSSQCIGIVPDDIPATFEGDGTIDNTTAVWTDELGISESTNIPVGPFNAVTTIPITMLQNIFSTAGVHFLRLDAPINSTGDVYVSNTVLFYLQPCPSITSFDPTSGDTGTSVQIYGSNFTGATSVTFGGTEAASFTVDSDTTITAVVGGGETGKIGVVTPYGTGTSSNDFTYTIGPGTYYVNSTTGNDANDGSAEHPWQTLHHAIELINDGATGEGYKYVLYVASGTYAVNQQEPENGEADEPMQLQQENVTIVGENGNSPAIIDGTGAQNWTTGLVMTGENLILQNINVTGFSDDHEEGIRITEGVNCQIRTCQVYGNSWGIRVSFSSYNLVSDCDIYQNSTHGIDVTWGSGNLVQNNKIHDNPMYGIRTQSSPTISRNLIYDNDCGIYVEAPVESSVAPSPIIQNNVIYQTETPGVTMSYGIFILKENFEYVSPEIYHNTIDGGSMSGIKMQKTVIEETDHLLPVIKYNIITNFEQHGIENIGATPTIDYNDVWNTDAITNYQGCTAGTHDITPPADPKYASYSLQPDSPCIDTIPLAEEDPVDIDYPGYLRLRPRPNEPDEDKDMGAYEYIKDETVDYELPTAEGEVTVADYRIFSIPLNLGTGTDMLEAMQSVLDDYDDTTWRGFLYNGADYDEFNSSAFGSHEIVPGMGFWIITTLTDTIPFTGKPAPDGVDFVKELAPGWHLVGLPWRGTSIPLSSIRVTDGVNTYPITDKDNGLTQQFLWDYTEEGYEMRTDALEPLTGYFFNVLSDNAIRVIIPTALSLANSATPDDTASGQAETVQNDETPPPPPGSAPAADIKANGMDGPVSVAKGDPVSITVTLEPGAWIGRNADWWVAAHTPFDPPGDWYTYVHPSGWGTGIHACLQAPLFEVMSPFPVLNMVLPPGSYTFYFAVDGNMDGKPDATWLDTVQVTVE
ncbi:IPT/TIG domain protein [delta proteobacterium NaphS2]|nr:IPT/TIG domain protein [delta proteobacterium NaphS2]